MNNKSKNNLWWILFIFIPLIACVLSAAIQATALWQINPYASLWNDEVFYYKQIESMVTSDSPQGYFGYNGSSAATGTLGAWPITLLLPYVFMGKIMGISPYNMIVFNIIFVTIAFAVFYYLVKPDKKQIIATAVLFVAFNPVSRYILSGMVEPLIFAALIVFVGYAIYFSKGKYTIKSLLINYIFVIYFALCRPWVLIFVLVPAYYHFKQKKITAIICTFLSIALFAAIYVLFIMPRCAAYLEVTINTAIFSILTQQGIIPFIKEVLFTTYTDGVKLFTDYVLVYGSFYASSIITLVILSVVILISTICNIIKNKEILSVKNGFAAGALLVVACVIWAIVLFYTEEQVARHAMALIICLQLIIAYYFVPKNKMVGVLIVAMLFFMGWNYSSEVYHLPTSDDIFDNMPVHEEAVKLSEVIQITDTENKWENTVFYVFPNVSTNYCYYLPPQTGINLCNDSYISENYKNISKGYLLTDFNKEKDEKYKAAGYTVLLQAEEFILYQAR